MLQVSLSKFCVPGIDVPLGGEFAEYAITSLGEAEPCWTLTSGCSTRGTHVLWNEAAVMVTVRGSGGSEDGRGEAGKVGRALQGRSCFPGLDLDSWKGQAVERSLQRIASRERRRCREQGTQQARDFIFRQTCL